MTIQIIQRAKFALLYGTKPTAEVERDSDGEPIARLNNHAETPVLDVAVFTINGRRYYSGSPKSAADAEQINDELETLCDMSLSEMQQ